MIKVILLKPDPDKFKYSLAVFFAEKSFPIRSMESPFSSTQVFFSRRNGVVNIHCDSSSPTKGVPLVFVFDMIGSNKSNEDKDADIRSNKIRKAKRPQKGSPPVEDRKQNTSAESVCGTCPLHMGLVRIVASVTIEENAIVGFNDHTFIWFSIDCAKRYHCVSHGQ